MNEIEYELSSAKGIFGLQLWEFAISILTFCFQNRPSKSVRYPDFTLIESETWSYERLKFSLQLAS